MVDQVRTQIRQAGSPLRRKTSATDEERMVGIAAMAAPVVVPQVVVPVTPQEAARLREAVDTMVQEQSRLHSAAEQEQELLRSSAGMGHTLFVGGPENVGYVCLDGPGEDTWPQFCFMKDGRNIWNVGREVDFWENRFYISCYGEFSQAEPGGADVLWIDSTDAEVTFAGKIGYGYTGMSSTGGIAVVQGTNKGTAVTIDRICGKITTHNASLAATTTVTFHVNNSKVISSDVIIMNLAGGGTAGAYATSVYQITNGGFDVAIRNLTAGALAEALVLNFAIMQADPIV